MRISAYSGVVRCRLLPSLRRQRRRARRHAQHGQGPLPRAPGTGTSSRRRAEGTATGCRHSSPRGLSATGRRRGSALSAVFCVPTAARACHRRAAPVARLRRERSSPAGAAGCDGKDSDDQRLRLRTRCAVVKCRSSPRPTARSAAVTVRRPLASSVPCTSVRACANVGAVNAAANGCRTVSSSGDGPTMGTPPPRLRCNFPSILPSKYHFGLKKGQSRVTIDTALKKDIRRPGAET